MNALTGINVADEQNARVSNKSCGQTPSFSDYPTAEAELIALWRLEEGGAAPPRRFAARPHILLAACFLADGRSSGWVYQGVCEEYEGRPV